MNLSKYSIIGAVVLTVSACGTTEKIVYMPPPETQPATTQPAINYPSRTSDERQFLNDVRDLYDKPIYVDDQLMIDAGYETCDLFRQGYTLNDVIDVLNESADGDSDIYTMLSSVVVAAVFNFCPEQEYRFSGASA